MNYQVETFSPVPVSVEDLGLKIVKGSPIWISQAQLDSSACIGLLKILGKIRVTPGSPSRVEKPAPKVERKKNFNPKIPNPPMVSGPPARKIEVAAPKRVAPPGPPPKLKLVEPEAPQAALEPRTEPEPEEAKEDRPRRGRPPKDQGPKE